MQISSSCIARLQTEAFRGAELGGCDGKLAVVMGASSANGFGAAIARRLATAGARVIIAGRRHNELDSLAGEIGALAQTCDITDETAVSELFEFAAGHGQVQIAVNAAGINHAAPIRKLDANVIRQISDVHFLGTLLFIKHAAAAMIRGGGASGAVISISTLTATLAGEGLALYSGTKAGADHAIRVAALEYGRAGIRVNSISPGLARTAMTEQYFAYPGFAEAFVGETPLGRLASVADVADAAVWLASEQNFVTGQNIQVSGGASLTRLPRADEIAAKAS